MLPMRPKNWPHHWKPNGKKPHSTAGFCKLFFIKNEISKRKLPKNVPPLSSKRDGPFPGRR